MLVIVAFVLCLLLLWRLLRKSPKVVLPAPMEPVDTLLRDLLFEWRLEVQQALKASRKVLGELEELQRRKKFTLNQATRLCALLDETQDLIDALNSSSGSPF